MNDEFDEQNMRLVLRELNSLDTDEDSVNRNLNIEEILIIQRGPRKKPLTWSPVEHNSTKPFVIPKEKTAHQPVSTHRIINTELRKRLKLDSERESATAKRLRQFISRKCLTSPDMVLV